MRTDSEGKTLRHNTREKWEEFERNSDTQFETELPIFSFSHKQSQRERERERQRQTESECVCQQER